MILRLAEMCRRLESEEEKLLPFYMSSLSWDDQKVVDKMIMEKPVESLAKVNGLKVGKGGVHNCLYHRPQSPKSPSLM